MDGEKTNLQTGSALDREGAQATREILEIISQSRSDEKPVFDAILRNAAHLSGASQANLCLLDDARTQWHLAAHYGDGLRHLSVGKTTRLLDSNLVPATTMRTGEVVHVEDLTKTDLYLGGDPGRVAMVEKEGMRTILGVPLLLNGQPIGCITLFRREVQAFSQGEIALLETFAAQAVIAIENVRQFREVQTRLEREAATREILQVISQSPEDEQPVFDTILQKASQLCHVPDTVLMLLTPDGTHYRIRAHHGTTRVDLAEQREWAIADPLPISQSFREARTIHIDDMTQSAPYLAGDPTYRRMVDEEGLLVRLLVSLMLQGKAFGVIALSRYERVPFSRGEIDLIETFAAQAVIAIENVRQFRALEALNAELGNRVEEQVGEIERMGKLKRFLPTAVADTVVSSGSEDMLKSHRALLGVLFCDIRGFTAFCETAEPEETIEVLQTYHEEMGKLINDHGAGVDHRMGDGIMVLFNDPIPCEDPAGDAVRLAVAMRSKMVELCRKWKRLGHRLGFGVGVSLGYATVGMVGYEGRSDYTASGTAVNLAARLCDLAEDGQILLSTRAAIAVEDDFPAESTGEVSLKGIREPVEVFRLSEGEG